MSLITKPLTEKQKKFAEIYCNSHGLLSNTECAVEAGYAKDSAYQRSHELLNPEICPHVVKYIREIEDDIKTKFSISKDSHMAELWRIREEAKKKNQTLVRLRAEELRGKLMGYYVEKKQQLNVNKTLNDMSEEELENKMNQIHKQYSHFINLEEPEKKIINAEIRGEQKAEKYKKGFDLATKKLREYGIKIDENGNDIEEDIKHLRSIQETPQLTEEEAKREKALADYQIRRNKERKNGKK
jgi:phage terminase small subunit